MDNLGRISVVAALSVSSALSAGCTGLSVSPETSTQWDESTADCSHYVL